MGKSYTAVTKIGPLLGNRLRRRSSTTAALGQWLVRDRITWRNWWTTRPSTGSPPSPPPTSATARPSGCKSMHSYDAIIDLGHHQTGQAARRLIALRVGGLQWLTMNYSFVILAVIQFVTQAVPADADRGRRGHHDRLSTAGTTRIRFKSVLVFTKSAMYV